MNIKRASEKTNLTKRAIKYYEDEGLINPIKNSNNNYREYSETDIIKLNLIGALRTMDITIIDIKNVIEEKKSIPYVMKEALHRINKSMDKLEKSKLIIINIIEKNLCSYDIAGESIIQLRQTLEFSINEKKEFISTILLRKFPGKFGEVFVAMYEPFLEISIDSEEKGTTWLKFVELLDEMDDIDENNYCVKWHDKKEIDEDFISKIKESKQEEVNKCLYNDGDNKDIKKISTDFIENLGDSEYRIKFDELMYLVRDMGKVIGPIQEKISEYLSILNKDYKKYNEYNKDRIKNMQEEVFKQTGLCEEEFIKKFNLKSKMQ